MHRSNLLYVLLFFSVVLSCKNEKNTDFVAKGTIKGLTKGTVYLEKVIDTLISPIDSFIVHDNGEFILSDALESPEIYYLRIKEIPKEKLLIFAEKGTVNIQSKLEKFVISAKVTGSSNHDILQEYNEMIQHFSNQKLDLIKANIEAEQQKDSLKLDSLNTVFKNMQRKRYLYTTNFAVNHADKEVAPYLALTELYNAKLMLLDTVNNSLTEEMKNSKYGKQLDRFIRVIRENETKRSENN